MNLLSIYLNDHLAGSVAGLELAKRTLDNNRGTEYEAFLERIVTEISEDKVTLETMFDRFGMSKSPVKPGVAWVAEKVGRLKLNGAITGYSPLSRLLEFEALRLGIQGKLCLWHSLREAAPSELNVPAGELDELIRRAEGQIELVEEHRLQAARIALGAHNAAAES